MECNFDCELFNRHRVNLHYPAVAVNQINTDYAAILSGIFAGRGSETTAIAQYTAHRFFALEYPEVYTAYRYIPFVEMTHFELLGSLIKRLGLNPKIYSYEDERWWSGEDPAYRYAIRVILDADMEGENASIAHYTRAISQIPNEGIQALLRRIILDEQHHLEILGRLYAGL